MPRSAFPLTALVIVLSASIGAGLLSNERKSRQEFQAQTRNEIEASFRQALSLIRDNYFRSVEDEALAQNSITEMLHSLDPHSNFFTQRQFSELQSEQRSRFFGIGVNIARRNGRVYLLSIIPGTPADRAGLRYGDAILAIDGQTATNLEGTQVMERVRGPRGEAVTLTVERAGEAAPLEFRIVRGAVPFPSIRNVFMIRPGVGYVALVGGFNDTTGDELEEAMGKLTRQGMQSLILDLRGNHGGLLDQAVEVSKRFLPSDEKVVTVRGRRFPPQEWTSGNSSPSQIPLVVLINSETASAAEIVAGAIQDHDRGLVIGETSFGKGLVQGIYKLPFGTGLLLTTAKYYTPTGRSIQRVYEWNSLYNYYYHRSPVGSTGIAGNQGSAMKTDNGRAVFGGGGITPDVQAKAPELDQTRIKEFGAAFEFCRQLAAGRVKGLESYRIAKSRSGYKLRGDEFPVSERVMAAFREFVASHRDFSVSESAFNSNLEYAQNRIRDELMAAAYGAEVGQQFALSHDPQALKAVELVPQARQLAEKFQARISARVNPAN